ncbi:MAG: hypothetical protein Kow0063_23530 [Anaerolineae bacterium]
MKIYHIQGIHHQAVVFAKTPEEAVAQAIRPLLVHAGRLSYLRPLG